MTFARSSSEMRAAYTDGFSRGGEMNPTEPGSVGSSSRMLPPLTEFLQTIKHGMPAESDPNYLAVAQRVQPSLQSPASLTQKAVASSSVDLKSMQKMDEFVSEVSMKLLNHSAMASAIVSQSGKVVHANRALLFLLGYQDKDLLGHPIADIIFLEDRDGIIGCIRQMLSGNCTSSQCPIRLVHDSHQFLWVLLHLTMIRDCSGHHLHFLAQMQDLLGLQKHCFGIDATVRQSEDRFRCAFEQAVVGMAVLGPDGKILNANSYLCSMLGYSSEQLSGKILDDLMHPDDRDSSPNLCHELIASQSSNTVHFNRRYIATSGRVVRAHAMMYRRLDSYGRTEYYVAQFRESSIDFF